MATLQASAFVGQSCFALPTGCSRPKSSYCNANSVRGGLIPYSRSAWKAKSSKLTQAPSPASLGFASSSITETRLRGAQLDMLNLGKGSGRGALGAKCSLPASPETLRWVFVAAASALIFLKSTGIPKHFLVPLLVLEAPVEALSWVKGDFGLWTAFLALAIKLFYGIPGELELPLYVLLFIITAPLHLTRYRASTASTVITLAIAGFLTYKHYKYAGGLEGSFQGEKIFPTIAILLVLIVPILFFLNGVI